ncbi:MAG: hypothetical protein AB1705_13640 [Verrucomicrobiota bacterium]
MRGDTEHPDRLRLTLANYPRVTPAEFVAERPPACNTAVIVCHGMGQQVPFETLNDIAQALTQADRDAGNRPDAATVRLLPQGESYLPRAELTLKKNCSVHLYEVYWAPFTEGEVQTSDVLGFLLQAGGRGLLAARHGSFPRFLFDDWRDMKVGAASGMLLAIALLVVLSMVAHVMAFGLLAVQKLITFLGIAPSAMNAPATLLVDRLFLNWTWVAAAFGAVFIGIAASGIFFSVCRLCERCKFIFMRLGLATALLLLIVPLGYADAALLGWHQKVPPGYAQARDAWNAASGVFSALVGQPWWALMLLWVGLLWYLNCKIVQYVGDVAAYISAHKLSRFQQIREKIQRTALTVAKTVYGQREYDQVIVVGHSLGSVIAYDMLNALIRDDIVTNDQPPKWNASARTSAFITFGSPLDKIAFLFRQYLKQEGPGVREGLATAVQPLTADASLWPKKWINIHSDADIISGELNYYDLAKEGGPPPYVENHADPDANLPLLAHTQYWKNRELRTHLYNAI